MNDRIQEIRKRLAETKKRLEANGLPMTSAVKDREYLLSEVERLTSYLERISVTFGEFECQRLAKEALSHLKG